MSENEKTEAQLAAEKAAAAAKKALSLIHI